MYKMEDTLDDTLFNQLLELGIHFSTQNKYVLEMMELCENCQLVERYLCCNKNRKFGGKYKPLMDIEDIKKCLLWFKSYEVLCIVIRYRRNY